MTVRDILGYIFIPLVLFLVGLALRSSGLISGERGTFYGIGELAMLTAVTMLIVGTTCLACQLPAGELPVLGVLLIIMGSVAVVGTGLFFDVLGVDFQDGMLGVRGGKKQLTDVYYISQLKTLFQFTVILVGAFIIPRMAKKPYTPEPTAPSRFERD